MSEWTAGAEEVWRRYAERYRRAWRDDEADVAEALVDLRAHLEEELGDREVVTEEDVTRAAKGVAGVFHTTTTLLR